MRLLKIVIQFGFLTIAASLCAKPSFLDLSKTFPKEIKRRIQLQLNEIQNTFGIEFKIEIHPTAKTLPFNIGDFEDPEILANEIIKFFNDTKFNITPNTFKIIYVIFPGLIQAEVGPALYSRTLHKGIVPEILEILEKRTSETRFEIGLMEALAYVRNSASNNVWKTEIPLKLPEPDKFNKSLGFLVDYYDDDSIWFKNWIVTVSLLVVLGGLCLLRRELSFFFAHSIKKTKNLVHHSRRETV